MTSSMQTGLYGKLPAYGDFIFRNLNSAFINPWDEWLQHFISGSQEQIGEGWLDIYLTSPIWRFTLSAGVIDSNLWAGIMMPSVDRVGRYFPITIVKPFAGNTNPISVIANHGEWFTKTEALCLSALNGELDADELVAQLDQVNTEVNDVYQATVNLGSMGPAVFALGASDEQHVLEALPFLLNASMTSSLQSYSVWQTAGSDYIAPVLFSCQGLPPIGSIASMIDGQWQQRNWNIPYNLQPTV